MAVITDPAMEIVGLCKFFGSIKPSKPNNTALHVLSEYFSESPENTYLILHHARKRFSKFFISLRDVEDPLLDEAILDLAKTAAQRFTNFTDLRHLGQPWPNHVKHLSDPQSWASIMAVSMVYRRHYPIKKLSDEEITQIQEKISDDAIIENVMDAEAPEFLKAAFRETILHLRVMLRYLPVFGLEELAKIAHDLDWKNRAVGVADNSYKQTDSYKKVLSAAMIAISIYVVPAEIIDATEKYVEISEKITTRIFNQEAEIKQQLGSEEE